MYFGNDYSLPVKNASAWEAEAFEHDLSSFSWSGLLRTDSGLELGPDAVV